MPYRRLATPDTRIEDEETREIEAFAATRRRRRQGVFVITMGIGTGVTGLAFMALGGMLSVSIAAREASNACRPAIGERSDPLRSPSVSPVLQACGRVRLP
jgi:hypothetical protein